MSVEKWNFVSPHLGAVCVGVLTLSLMVWKLVMGRGRDVDWLTCHDRET